MGWLTPLKNIVPSTKRMHSTLGAQGCVQLAWCRASSRHRVCLGELESPNLPKVGSRGPKGCPGGDRCGFGA